MLALVPLDVEKTAEKPIGMRYSNIRAFSPKEVGMSKGISPLYNASQGFEGEKDKVTFHGEVLELCRINHVAHSLLD